MLIEGEISLIKNAEMSLNQDLVQRRKNNKFLQTLSQIKKTKYLQMLAIPGIIYYIIFRYIPMYGVIIAFKDYNMRLGILDSPWVGFEHFIRFFNHPHFFRLMKNTILINIYSLIFAFPAPIILALFLNEVKNGFYKRFVQTVSYLPHFISTVSIVGMLFMFLSPSTGFVNRILTNVFGIEPIYFIVEPRWFRTIYIASGIWSGVGWGAIIYLAALSNVGAELYEAARIDGATRIQMMRHVSIPCILPTIVVLLIFEIGGMLSVGADKMLLMQTPLTYEVSDVISTYVYRRGIVHAEYSFSAAVGLFNSVVNLMLISIANFIAKKTTESSLW